MHPLDHEGVRAGAKGVDSVRYIAARNGTRKTVSVYPIRKVLFIDFVSRWYTRIHTIVYRSNLNVACTRF